MLQHYNILSIIFHSFFFVFPNIIFGWVSAVCEVQHNDFQIIAVLDNAIGTQSCFVYSGF